MAAAPGPLKTGGERLLAKALDLDRKAVGVAVNRMRNRYEQLVRMEVAHTVETKQQIDEEIRALDLERHEGE